MDVSLKPGKYILAVSGGVDSVALLDLLSNLDGVELVVAHFNHGIRRGAGRDEKLVENLAAKYGLVFEAGQGSLGPDASEEQARQARYGFLKDMKDKYEADKIVTAHHQDDLIETAFINILRGTGSRGLVAIAANADIARPLLGITKKEIIYYAKQSGLEWVEDETNQDTRYLRNMVRQLLSERLTQKERGRLLRHLNNLQELEAEKDELLAGIGRHVLENSTTIKRTSFVFLPAKVASEVVHDFLRNNDISSDRKTIGHLSIIIKTGRPGTLHNIDKSHKLRLSADKAYLVNNS